MRVDVLRILMILQKLVDESKIQKQKVAKLEIKIKDLEGKVDHELHEALHHGGHDGGHHDDHHHHRKSTSDFSKYTSASDHSDYHHVLTTSEGEKCDPGVREYELKFDRFKQEVNKEFIKVNSEIEKTSSEFSSQIASLKNQMAHLFVGKMH